MKWIKPSEASGAVQAPASKSLTIRALAAASLCRGDTEVQNPSFCDDGLAALDVIRGLGAEVARTPLGYMIKGGIRSSLGELDCGESGLCIRMFAPIAALEENKIYLKGKGSLLKRPMNTVSEALIQMGAECSTHDGFPPIMVKGPLKGGETVLDGSLTSQVLTGLLTALPCCAGDSLISVLNLASRPYVEMTLSVLRHFGIEIKTDQEMSRFAIAGGQRFLARPYRIEGDWSGASFLLTAGAVSGSVSVHDLNLDSLQADKKILDVLRACGARVYTAPNSVSVKRGDLRAFEFDAADCPDLFPPLAVLASACRGKSRITGVHRLRHKESDRARVLKSELTKIGLRISISEDSLEIIGGALRGGEMDSHGDHRIAMAGAVAGLIAAEGVKVGRWKAVSKSYPDFFHDLKNLRGEIV
jgi:3-phosphoshikimate 1-carboxyvinyltransferase